MGEGVRMGDKCAVQKSVIGRHCLIGNNVKLNNVVVMDHVIIGNELSVVAFRSVALVVLS